MCQIINLKVNFLFTSSDIRLISLISGVQISTKVLPLVKYYFFTLVRWEATGTLGGRSSSSGPAASRLVSAGPLLILPRARPQDSGRYVCRASNSVGAARMEATLVVTAPLAVRVQPPALTASLGHSAALRCTVSGHPVDVISWTKDGQVRPMGTPY